MAPNSSPRLFAKYTPNLNYSSYKAVHIRDKVCEDILFLTRFCSEPKTALKTILF